MPPVVTAGQKKRGPRDQGDEEGSRGRSRTMASPIVPVAPPDAGEMDDAPIPLNLKREGSEKRRASKEARDEYRAGEEKKGPRLTHPDLDSLEVEDALMSRLEREEKKTMHVATEITTCR